MNSTRTGASAEQLVAADLKQRGFRIIARNWRRRSCEIDIIATKDNIIYFVEVKYRRNETQGSGLDYITDRKIKQLKFAAQMWNADNPHESDWRILAVEVESLNEKSISNYVEIV